MTNQTQTNQTQNNQTNQASTQTKPNNPSSQNNPANEPKISRRQFFFVIIQTQIGVGILSLPYDLHESAKQDGWISLLIGGFLLQFVLLLLWWIAKTYPDIDFFKINEKIFSKWIGKPFSFLFVLYFTCVGLLIILLFCRIISLWVLPNTPFWILAFLMISVSMYMTCCGLRVMARLYTFLSFFLLI
ncbi:GerAB/ArcD/ProY family transporter, partial [Halobacillus sp. BBL2006]|uniref:GerAB/ArcD/ProY family transporter n=1 Tax=Halobacillus sp. BBL2006 TaxID=1543706 RepID=UPI0018CCB593